MELVHFVQLIAILWVALAFPIINGKPSSVIPGDNGKVSSGSYRAYISYRPSTSRYLAKLLKVALEEGEHITTFLDVDNTVDCRDREAVLKKSPNFIVILSTGTLDECNGDIKNPDHYQSDCLRELLLIQKEIKAAVESKRNIIPVFDDFTMPKVTFPEIDEMLRFQGVEWKHTLAEGSFQRLLSYLRH